MARDCLLKMSTKVEGSLVTTTEICFARPDLRPLVTSAVAGNRRDIRCIRILSGNGLENETSIWTAGRILLFIRIFLASETSRIIVFRLDETKVRSPELQPEVWLLFSHFMPRRGAGSANCHIIGPTHRILRSNGRNYLRTYGTSDDVIESSLGLKPPLAGAVRIAGPFVRNEA